MNTPITEIGGYFGLESFSGTEYHENLIAVNTGRNALAYVLKARKIKKLYIPTFLCDCVERLCMREGCAYEKYSVGTDFMPRLSENPGAEEWVYVVNYYGQVSDEVILAMQKRWGRIIVDHVQDFFRKPLPGIDTIYSCRKFFGVADGAYLSTDATLETEPDKSRHRMEHVLGRFETSASQYFSIFQKNDEALYDLPLRQMSRLTRNLLRAIDYEVVRRKRTENFSVLEEKLGSYNKLKIAKIPGAYCYPFLCDNGAEIRKRLVQQKIYIPTLWPNVTDDPAATELEKFMAQNILPLPCDQRYGTEDMRHMAQAVMAALK